MAKKNKEEVTVVGEDVKPVEPVEFVVPEGAIIDKQVTVISLASPYHKEGEEFGCAERTAKILAERGWVKIKE